MASISCFLIGGGTLLQECGELLRRQGHSILGVISGSEAIRTWAVQCGLEHLDPSECISKLERQPFDHLFSVAHLEKLADRILALPRRGAINFHDGPLPRYSGLNAPAWALINQERHYGVCWHRMTAAIDQGPILKRASFPVDSDETAVSLNTKCLAAGLQTFAQLIADLAGGGATEELQGGAGRSYFGKYQRPATAAVLDWSRPGAELEALVRGLQFGNYPNPLGSPKVFLKNAVYIVTDARLASLEGVSAPASEIIAATDEYVRVATGSGALDLWGLSDLLGRHVNIGQLEVQRRERLAVLPADAAARLAELDALMCRSEPFWTERLSTLAPISAPLATPGTKGGHVEPVRRSLRLPPELASKFPRGVAETALLAMLLARLERQSGFDLALTDARWSARILGFKGLIAEEACCRFSVSPEVSFQALAQTVAMELEQLHERGAWLHDLCARQPALAGGSGTEQLPVGVALGVQPESWQPAAPTRALTLAVAGDGEASALVSGGALSSAGLETLAQMIETLAAAVAAKGPGQPMGSLPLLDADAFRRVILDWNQTDSPPSRMACIHSQIEEQARANPDRTALVFADQQLSYRAMNERANRLAARLTTLGVGPDRLVGVHVVRSIDMVVATLAVLKAGAAYVPLDPDFPSERIAYMIRDAGLAAILTQKSLHLPSEETGAKIIFLDEQAPGESALPATNPAARTTAATLAYVIYTSGSTGRPKGVMVEHGNVTNFFAAMDACLPHDPPGTWLAVTSLSFDISVLELLWTLARGFKVVIQGEVEESFAPARGAEPRGMAFGLFMWGNDDAPGRDKYRLMLEGAKYFDRNGFEAVWTPERHFHAFGGPYPNPSVTGAALAAVTERIGIRAGSCVSPLHHPIRIAEEWAVVDNLSNGRVALAFASGWQPNDFVLRPENHADNKRVMVQQIDQVRRLWRGEKVSFRNPLGQDVATGTLPRPVQAELPFWVTTAGNPDTYREAGELGANILTHLLGQSVEEVARKIDIYRKARAAAGHDPATGRVTLMLHTFVGDDDDDVREIVRQPMKEYLRSSLKLVVDFAWSFPAFKRPGGGAQKPADVDLRSLPESEIDAILDFAFDRYFETSGLFGTPATCARMIERCKQAGVDEIACLLDFGVQTERVLASLPRLNEVRKQANPRMRAAAGAEREAASHSVAAQILRHGVTHLQCTPSLARMLLLDPPTRTALAGIRQMLVGGEALPAALAEELKAAIGGELRNMYGPTETTVWSTTQAVASGAEPIPIGRPIANTQVYVLDGFGHPVPPGVPGELYIGGAGVARGYLNQPGLTSERFVRNRFVPATDARMYRTGDLARFLPDGAIEYLGRADHQVKIRGHRVELEEIERLLGAHLAVEQAAVILRGGTETDPRLVAYVVAAPAEAKLNVAELRDSLRRQLPDYMVPSDFVTLERLPLTPNGKLNRKALPAPDAAAASGIAFVAPETETERALATMWQELLKVDRVGARDNFFELGGHSLLAMQAVSRLRQALAIELPLRELFAAPVLSALAARIDTLRNGARPDIAAGMPVRPSSISRPAAGDAIRERFEL